MLSPSDQNYQHERFESASRPLRAGAPVPYNLPFPNRRSPGPGAILVILACLGALLSILLFKRFDAAVTPPSPVFTEPAIAPAASVTNI